MGSTRTDLETICATYLTTLGNLTGAEGSLPKGEDTMTGRELIVYILVNGLENEEVYKDGKVLGFMTAVEAAAKFEVGVSTIILWVQLDMLPGVTIGKEVYIPANAQVKGAVL